MTPCQPNPCNNNGTCVVSHEGYKCQCHPIYMTGTDCTKGESSYSITASTTLDKRGINGIDVDSTFVQRRVPIRYDQKFNDKFYPALIQRFYGCIGFSYYVYNLKYYLKYSVSNL